MTSGHSSEDMAAFQVLLALNDKLVEKRCRTVDLFRKIDESGDGVVSPDEFREGLTQFGFSPSNNEFRALMKYLDKDGDGEVDYREFDKAIKKVIKMESEEDRAKRLASERALEPVEGAVSDAYLQSLLEKCQKKSHFFRGFTKQELRSLLKVSVGTITFSSGQAILPPNIDATWVGIVVAGVCELRPFKSPDEVHAKYGVGCVIRAQQFVDQYHDTFVGHLVNGSASRSGASGENNAKSKVAKLKGVLSLDCDRRGQTQMPLRVGLSVSSACPGAPQEYTVGGDAPEGMLCCWGPASIDILREADGTKDLAYRFLRLLTHAQSCEYRERFHQVVWKERKAANDDTGMQEAAKIAALNKKMKAIEEERKEMAAAVEKAKKAMHSAKNSGILFKQLEKKLAKAEAEVKTLKKSGKSGTGDNTDGGDDGGGKEGKNGGASKAATAKHLAAIKKLKKMLAEEKANSKRKLEQLRKMMSDQAAKKVREAEKGGAKRVDAKIAAVTSKLKRTHDAEVGALKKELATLRARLAELEEGAEAAEARALAEAEAKRKSEIERTAKMGWAKLRAKQKEDAAARKAARDKFSDVMRSAQTLRLTSIRDQAVAQLETLKQQLLEKSHKAESAEEMVREAEEMKSQMESQVSSMMALVGEAQAESAELASQLKLSKAVEAKSRWGMARQKFKDEAARRAAAQMETALGVAKASQKALRLKLADEQRTVRQLRREIMSLEDTLEGARDNAEARRLWLVLAGVALHATARTSQRREEARAALEQALGRKTEECQRLHQTIVAHVAAADEQRRRLLELKGWCKTSHRHRRRLEDLVGRFDVELNAARDAIWAQSVRLQELSGYATKMAAGQVAASEVRAVMVHRLRVSEARRLELEARFSTLARASTPLLEELRAVEMHAARVARRQKQRQRGEDVSSSSSEDEDEGEDEDYFYDSDGEDRREAQTGHRRRRRQIRRRYHDVDGGSEYSFSEYRGVGGGAARRRGPWVSPYLRRIRERELQCGDAGEIGAVIPFATSGPAAAAAAAAATRFMKSPPLPVGGNDAPLPSQRHQRRTFRPEDAVSAAGNDEETFSYTDTANTGSSASDYSSEYSRNQHRGPPRQQQQEQHPQQPHLQEHHHPSHMLQQRTLVRPSEAALLDPSRHRLLFVGCDPNTNALTSTILRTSLGYTDITTVRDLEALQALVQEYRGAHRPLQAVGALNERDERDEQQQQQPRRPAHTTGSSSRSSSSHGEFDFYAPLCATLDLILVDLSVVPFTVPLLLRALGSPSLLGPSFHPDNAYEIPLVLLSSRESQRESCKSIPGCYFVKKPPVPHTLGLVMRSALGRRANLLLAHARTAQRRVWDPTPNPLTDAQLVLGLHGGLGGAGGEAGGGDSGEQPYIVQLGLANKDTMMPSPLMLPFTCTPESGAGSRSGSRSSSHRRQFPFTSSKAAAARAAGARRLHSAQNGRNRKNLFNDEVGIGRISLPGSRSGARLRGGAVSRGSIGSRGSGRNTSSGSSYYASSTVSGGDGGGRGGRGGPFPPSSRESGRSSTSRLRMRRLAEETGGGVVAAKPVESAEGDMGESS